MNTCFVFNCYYVNLRSNPNSETNINIIASLPLGHECTILNDEGTWWEVQTEIGIVPKKGYIKSDFLTLQPPEVNIEESITEVHLPESQNNIVNPNSTLRAHPINDSNRVFRDSTTEETKISSIHRIIEYLNVEESIRYRRNRYTYCNIYAYDFCYLCKVYLPRVWWMESSLIRLSKGEKVKVEYGKTVLEKRANDLFYWLKEFGATFGWKRVFDTDELQEKVDKGGVGIIVANTKNHNRSGHIVVVVPQKDSHRATMKGEKVVTPLMSQAGASNKEYFSRRWWNTETFSFFGFWVHD